MPRTGTATTRLHTGYCPPWLFDKMRQLSAAVVEAIILEYGTEEVLHRFSDPVWFQAFGSLLGFDWHSSGLTTVVLGAFKEGWRDRSHEYGLFLAGGKGRVSRNTPQEIKDVQSREAIASTATSLVESSRLAAKVDSALVQDGYALYHHVFLFNREGRWAVVQQGMNETTGMARRYHWLSETVRDITVTPHQAVVGRPESHVLDLTARANLPVHQASVELVHHPEEILQALRRITEAPDGSRHLEMPWAHLIPKSSYLNKVLYQAYEADPQTYTELVGLTGVGAGTIRALAMATELIHGTALSYRDPVRYSFAHGGKDGTPFFIKRSDYDRTCHSLERALSRARIGETDRLQALRRLSQLARS